jgi:phospholipid/cholesterol/gamma-HCH transport system ATP-binding protein
MDEAIIRFDAVSKRFGDKEVLRSVDLSIPKGKTTVILGPSGTGKSVCLKLMVGLLQADEGTVEVEGVDMGRAPERSLRAVRRRIGMMFQDGALFDSLDVYENIAFPLRRHTDMGEDAIEAAVALRLAQVGLPGIETRMPASLSGGMRKRVSLARAIVTEPDIVLFDEPNSGLDPVTSDEIDALIERTQAELGITFVVISHDIVGTFRVADRIAMLYNGARVMDGTPDEFRDSDDPVVQRFLARNLGPRP